MPILQSPVVLGRVFQKFQFPVIQWADLPDRTADVQITTFEAFTGRHHAASAYRHPCLYYSLVHHNSAHPNQAIILYSAGVQNHLVTDRDIIANDGRLTAWTEPAVMSDMNNGAVLNICLLYTSRCV